jgi:hypothetical protein
MIVFFEVSVLLAASIFVTKIVQHKRYSDSRGLINKSRGGEITGITSITVERQAERTLEIALKRTIDDEGALSIDKTTTFEPVSTIFDVVQRNLNYNIESLDRLKTDRQETDKIASEEIYPLYYELYKTKFKEIKPFKPYTESPIYKRLASTIYLESRRRFDKTMTQLDRKSIVPDDVDIQILSDAVFLKRNRFKKAIFYIASLDNHFCGKKDPYTSIPIEIEKKFEIKCRLPNEILTNIETELGDFPKSEVKV